MAACKTLCVASVSVWVGLRCSGVVLDAAASLCFLRTGLRLAACIRDPAWMVYSTLKIRGLKRKTANTYCPLLSFGFAGARVTCEHALVALLLYSPGIDAIAAPSCLLRADDCA